MQQIRFVIPVLAIAAIAIILVLTKHKPDTTEQVAPTPVRVATLNSVPPREALLISGTTRSAESALLRFQVSGRVLEKNVSLGDVVAQGDTLATVYNPELAPLVERAEGNLARSAAQTKQAERDFNRVDELFKQQAVTRQEWEQSRTRLTSAEEAQSSARADLARAQQIKAELNLTAPFAGTVTEILIDKGEVVNAGNPAVRLSNPAAVELALPVSDKVIEQVTIGQVVKVSKALSPKASAIDGRVIEISPFRERGALPEIKVAVDAGLIGPGTAVTARLDIQASSGISLPLKSVIMTGENTVAVYRVENGQATLVPIRPVNINADTVVIEQGLQAGDTVVTEGIAKLYDGAQIEIAEVTGLEVAEGIEAAQ